MVIFWMIIPSLICLSVYLAWQIQKTNEKWMRLFSESRGVPIPVMEGTPEKPPTPVPIKEKKRFSVPIPNADFMRKPAE